MTDYGVEVDVIMPTYSLSVVADTEEDAIKQALCELSESGAIPEHGEVDVSVYDLSTYSIARHWV